MKRYHVEKCEFKTEKWFDYGTMCEEDMKLVTRGYTQDPEFPEMYTRKNGKFMFIVNEVK